MNPSIIGQIAEAVRACGQIMLHADRQSFLVDEKEGHGNFVTTYDKRVQQILQEKLTAILPEAVFVGEEEEDHADIRKGYAFIVDPIDGTMNFIKDYHASAISVGITRDGEAYAGVIYNPYLDEMFTGLKGHGAFLNGRPIHVSETPLEKGLVLFGTAPYYEELNEQTFRTAFSYFKRASDLRRSGSAALDLACIAAGRAELFFELRLSPWDYAAGAAIIGEAGGVITTCEGEKLSFDRRCSVLATSRRVREEL